MAIALDCRPGSRIIPEFIALAVKSGRFRAKVLPTLVLMPRRHRRGRLFEEISSRQVMQFGHRQIAFGRARSRGLDQLLILGLLGPLAKFPCLLRRRDLRLFRLTEKLMRLGKVTSLDLRLGLFHETARQRVTRVERGKLCLKLLKLSGNLGQLLRQLLERHITLTEDEEHG